MRPTLQSFELLDRRGDLREDAAAQHRMRSDPQARFLVLCGGRPVISSNAERTRSAIRWLTAEERTGLANSGPFLFLGLTRDTGCPRFAVALPDESAADPALQPAVDLRSLATQGTMADAELSLIGAAKALADWHRGHGFCARCGTASLIASAGWRRVCPACGAHAFPRTDPVVIMLIVRDGRCVLTREGRFPERMYSLPAGYVEPGEDIEHAVRRETEEELGLNITAVRYALSQPWPFPHSLMIGCKAEASPGELTLDPAELEAAFWATPQEVNDMISGTHPGGLWVPGPQAIAHVLLRQWLAACEPSSL